MNWCGTQIKPENSEIILILEKYFKYKETPFPPQNGHPYKITFRVLKIYAVAEIQQYGFFNTS